jgi:hypothetical protein
MSWKLLPKVVRLDLPQGEKTILTRFVDHADDDGNNAYPSRALVSWETGYEIRQVGRLMQSLVDKGVLIRRGKTPTGQYRYSVNLDAVPEKAPFRGDEPVFDVIEVVEQKDTMSFSPIVEQKDILSDCEGQDVLLPSEGLVVPLAAEGLVVPMQKDILSEQKDTMSYKSLGNPKMNPQDDDLPSIHHPLPTAHTREIVPVVPLREILALEAPDIGFRTFKEFFSAFWSVYPKQGRVDKHLAEEEARTINPKEWVTVVQCAENYTQSTVVLEGKARNAVNFLRGETYAAYSDGPQIRRVAATPTQSEQKVITMSGIMGAASDYARAFEQSRGLVK